MNVYFRHAVQSLRLFRQLILTSVIITVSILLPHSASAAPSIQHWLTATGARVYFVAADSLPILDVRVDFPGGSAYDPPEKSGLSALSRSLLDAGTNSLNEEQIAARWVDLGAQYHSTGDFDRSAVQLRTLSAPTQRQDALALFQQILTQPLYPVEALEREKARAIASLREAATRPEHIAAKSFAAALYPQHPYGVSSTEHSIAAITQSDLINFRNRHFNAKNAVISIIGAVTRQEAERIADDLTRNLPSATEQAKLPTPTLPQALTQKIAHPAKQSHILLGTPAVMRGDPNYFPLLVGNYTLGGGGFVSRLMQEVREKRGYAYSVYSHFDPRLVAGPFQIGLQTKREQSDAALAATRSVLEKFLSEGPSEQEIIAAKNNLMNSLALRIDSNAKLLDYLAVIGFYQLPLTYLDDFAHKVKAVSRAQIRAAFASHIKPAHLVTVVVAPQE